MLPRSFKAGKCKTSLRLAISRIKLMKNKKDVQLKQMKRELAQLLETGQDQTARIRVVNAMQEEKTIAAYDFIELYCEQIVARLFVIEAQKKCPVDLKEAVSTVIFASPRCADVPELSDIRKQFAAKYGKEFVETALELRPDSGVNHLVVEKLSGRTPDAETKFKFLAEIAKENNIKWNPPAFEEKKIQNEPVIVKDTPVERSPSVQPRPSTREPRVPAPRTQKADAYRQDSDSDSDARRQDSDSVKRPTGRTGKTGKPPDPRNVEGETSLNSQKWQFNFKDAASAAQAAAEAADRASMAAKAAVELASPKSSPRSSFQARNSEKHSILGRTLKDSEVDLEEDQSSRDHVRVSDRRKISGKSRDEENEDGFVAASRVETKIERPSSSRSSSVDHGTNRDSPRRDKSVDQNSFVSSGQQVKYEESDEHKDDTPPPQFDPSDSESEVNWNKVLFPGGRKSTLRVESNPSPKEKKSVADKDDSMRSVKSRSGESSSDSEAESSQSVDRGQRSTRNVFSGKEERADALNLGTLKGGLRNRDQSRLSFTPKPSVYDSPPSAPPISGSPRKSTVETLPTSKKTSSSRPRRTSDSDDSDSDDPHNNPPDEEKKDFTSLKKQDAREPARKISYYERAASSSKKPNKEPDAVPASYESVRKSKQIRIPFFDGDEEEEDKRVKPPPRTFMPPMASQRTRTPIAKPEKTEKQSLPQRVSKESVEEVKIEPSTLPPRETDKQARVVPPSTVPPKNTEETKVEPPKEAKVEPRGILPPREGASHVHPNLPDYDVLRAHFSALRSNRR